jgi:hypothetical protein
LRVYGSVKELTAGSTKSKTFGGADDVWINNQQLVQDLAS